MKEATAKHLVDLLLRHCKEQNQILNELRAQEPTAEFERIKIMIGQSMGHIFFDALTPIFQEHPILEPKALRSKGKGNQSAD